MTVTLGVNLMSREGNSQTGHRMNVETHHSIAPIINTGFRSRYECPICGNLSGEILMLAY